jgi:hypothetical protein
MILACDDCLHVMRRLQASLGTEKHLSAPKSIFEDGLILTLGYESMFSTKL